MLLTTGGTGGHIFPALAVAQEFVRQYPGLELLFVGGQYGPEKCLVTEREIAFVGLPVRGVLGRGFKVPAALTAMGYALCKAMGIVRRFAPDVAVGFGGYAAFAAMLAARCGGIPCMIHEQNSVPGVTNRLLGKMADRVCISFPDRGEHFLRRKTILTGNPVRAEIVKAAALRSREKAYPGRRLLIMGGSQGARAVNDAVLSILPVLREAGVEIVHQTGATDFERVRDGYARVGFEARVEAFVDDVAALYAWADLALCRAGATTVFELAAAGIPAVFIPFPHATHNHQTVNAAYLADKGAALLIPQHTLAGGEGSGGAKNLADVLVPLLHDKERLQGMSRAARELARPEAAASIVSAAKDLVQKKPLGSLNPVEKGE